VEVRRLKAIEKGQEMEKEREFAMQHVDPR
jgi:hypothetical protein